MKQGNTGALIGRKISHYRIQEQLGRGGMAVVYLAEDTWLRRQVAMKFLPLGMLDETTARRRFFQEAQSASALDHPNICTIYEIDETPEGQLFIVMAYYPGETLDRRIARGAMPVSEAVDVAIQAAHGLGAAHKHGIVHRDVKPANLMITPDRVVKILDFGVAKLGSTPDPGDRLTQEGTAVGTVTYMSPEQVRGLGVDHRSDLWSLGVVFYEMLTGKVPFRGDSHMAALHSILHEEIEPIDNLGDGDRGNLDLILDSALAKETSDRYQDATEMLNELHVLRQASTSVTLITPAYPPASLPPQQSDGESSVGVLPFADLSAEQDQEYFCCGMAEELINLLTRVPGLRVASRTSAFQFLGRSEDIRKIGRKLNVDWVLEGSVRKAGSRLRISAQLTKVADGYHLWSSRYDRELRDLFDIQDEIAAEIAEALETTLIKAPPRTTAGRDTASLEAYNLYLKGRFCWNKRTEDDLHKGIGYFQQALESNPDYSRAYAGLADSYAILGIYGAARPRDVMPRAKAYGEQALALNPNQAEVYTALGCVRANYDWDFAGARQDFRRGLELDPNYATTHQWYAMNCLLPLGYVAQAGEALKRAQQLDPLSPAIQISLGLLYFYSRRYREATEAYRTCIDMDGSFAMAHCFLAQAYEQVGMYDEAVKEHKQAARLSGGSLEITSALAHTYGRMGQTQRAEELLDALRTTATLRYVAPTLFACCYTGLGRIAEALDALDDAVEARAADLVWTHVRPYFDPLRGETRFQELLERIGLSGTLSGGEPPPV